MIFGEFKGSYIIHVQLSSQEFRDLTGTDINFIGRQEISSNSELNIVRCMNCLCFSLTMPPRNDSYHISCMSIDIIL